MSGFFGYPGGPGAVAQGAASALIAGLWESAVLVAGVWLVLKAVPRTTAAARFAIWTAVFFVSAAMPVAGWIFGVRADAAPGSAAGVHVDARWSYAIAAVWVVAVLMRLAGLTMQGWKLRGLWKRAVPVSDEVMAAAGCEDLIAEQRVQVCTSEDVDRPSVIGYFAPRILVPAWLFEQLSPVELRHIVLHETEHLRRRDDWMNLVQKIGLVVFPLNPALLWVDRRLAAERELACDDGVLRRTQTPRAYASSLASIAGIRLERRMHRRAVALALGMLGAARILRGRSEFSRRIERILCRRAVVSPMMAGAVATVLVVTVMVAGVGLARAPQLVSFAPVSGAESFEAASERGSTGGAGVREVSFRVPDSGSSSSLEMRSQSVPQRLKPHGNGVVYGTAKAVSLSKTTAGVRAGAVSLRKTSVSMSAEAVLSGKTSAPAEERSLRTERVIKQQWMVLTSFSGDSFDEDAPARVVVRFEDGRFCAVPYAAVPVQDGWLIVQL